MNITVCDLCRREVEPPGAKVGIEVESSPPRVFLVSDVCERCIDAITAFLDGLKDGPPGVSMMLPKGDENGDAKQ